MLKPRLSPENVTLIALLVLWGGISPSTEGGVIRKSGLVKAKSPVTCMATHDGKDLELATGHQNGEVRWWNGTGKETRTAWPILQHPVTAIVFIKSGQTLVVATQDRKLHVFDVKTSKKWLTFETHGTVTKILDDASADLTTISSRIETFSTDNGKLTGSVEFKGKVKFAGYVDNRQSILFSDDEKLKIIPLNNVNVDTDVAAEKFNQGRGDPRSVSFTTIQKVHFASFPGGVLVPFRSWIDRTDHEVKIPGFDEFDIEASTSGRSVVCLGPAGQGKRSQGVIWDLEKNVKVGDLADLPAEWNEVEYGKRTGFLAIRDRKGQVTLWDTSGVPLNKGPLFSILNGQLDVSRPMASFSLPAVDPSAPLKHPSWKFTRWSHPQAPAYFNGAWKVEPLTLSAYPGSIQVDQPGAFFYIPVPMSRDTPDEKFEAYLRRITIPPDQWMDLGPCPWRPQSRMFIDFRSPGDPVPPHGLQFHSGDELYYVPGFAFVQDEAVRTYPPDSRESLYRGEAARRFRKEDFAWIEKQAEEARTSRSMFSFGHSRLEAIYMGIGQGNNLEQEKLQAVCDRYLLAYPDSLTARIIVGSFTIEEGYDHRGSDIATNVSDEQFEEFHTRLKLSRELLEDYVERVEEDPYVAYNYIRSSPGSGMTADSLINMAMIGLREDLLCLELIDSTVLFLQRRWTGEAKAPARFAAQLKEKFPGDLGKALAARVATQSYLNERRHWNEHCDLTIEEFRELSQSYRRLAPGDDHFALTSLHMELSATDDLQTQQRIWRELLGLKAVHSAMHVSYLREGHMLFEKPRPSQCVWSKWTDLHGLVAFQPDGAKVSLADSAGRVEYFNREEGRPTGKQDRPYLGLRDFVVDKNGVEYFLTGNEIVSSEGQTVDYPPIAQLRESNSHEAISPDGRRIVLVRDDGTVTIVNTVTGDVIARFEKLVSQDSDVEGRVVISPDARRVAVQTEVAKVALIDLATGKRQGELSLKDDSLVSMCFHGGNSRLVIVGDDNIVEFDTSSLRPVSTMPSPKSGWNELRISPNGKLWSLAFRKPGRYFDGSVLILDRRDSKASWRILPGVRNSASVVWHPQKPEMCLISEAGVLSYWDLDRKMSPEELTASIVPERRPRQPPVKSPFPKPVGATIKK